MAYDAIVASSERIDAQLFVSASNGHLMIALRMRKRAFDSQVGAQRGISGLSQPKMRRCRALSKGRETAIECTGGLLQERLELVFDKFGL